VSAYRKKPVVIDALLWTGENFDDVASFMGVAAPYFDNGYVLIDTLEGTMKAVPGDWIIKGVKGEFYPVAPDVFEQTYEPVVASSTGRTDEESKA